MCSGYFKLSPPKNSFCLFQEREEKIQCILEEERQGFIRSLQCYKAHWSSRVAAYRRQVGSLTALLDGMKQLTQSEGRTYKKSVMTCCKILVHSSVLQEKMEEKMVEKVKEAEVSVESEWRTKLTGVEGRAKVSYEELQTATSKIKDMEKILEKQTK